MENIQATTTATTAILADDMREHWQGHRRLTRRVIEAFPEDQFLTFSIGGMRTAALLAAELTGIAAPGVIGAATGDWSAAGQNLPNFRETPPASKQQILDVWDRITDIIDTYWPQITTERFQETDKAFGLYEDKVYSLVLYFIDNEIHHRGQMYVYLRALGIEPPAFYER